MRLGFCAHWAASAVFTMVFETLSGLEVKTEPKEKSRRNRSSFHLLEESVKALSKGTSLVSVEWLPLSANLGLCSRTVNETASESFWLKVQVNLSRGRESPALIQELKRLSAEESTEEIGCDLDFYSCFNLKRLQSFYQSVFVFPACRHWILFRLSVLVVFLWAHFSDSLATIC